MGKKGKKKGPPPVCNCCLLCDEVVQRFARQKDVLEGIINGLNVEGFPARLAVAVIYIRLTNLRPVPNETVKVDFVHSGDDSCVVLSGTVEVPDSPDPFGVYTLTIAVRDLIFPRSGRYLLRVMHDEVPLAHTPIEVIGPESGDEKENDNADSRDE